MNPYRPTRRAFLHAGAGAAGTLATGILPAPSIAETGNADPMKVTRIESVTFRDGIRIGGGSGGADGAEFCWVRLHRFAMPNRN